MSDENKDSPVLRRPEAEEIDLEVMEEEGAGAEGETMSPGDFFRMGPEMVVKAVRDMLKDKLKKWFIRNALVITVLALFASDSTFAKWLLGIWIFFAGIHLAVLVFGWWAAGKQAEKLAQVFGGMMPPGPPGPR